MYLSVIQLFETVLIYYLYIILCCRLKAQAFLKPFRLDKIKTIPTLFFLYTTENIADNFLESGQYVARGHSPDDIQPVSKQSYNMIMVDITTTFTTLIGIFFPSVTGQYFFFCLNIFREYGFISIIITVFVIFTYRNHGRF